MNPQLEKAIEGFSLQYDWKSMGLTPAEICDTLTNALAPYEEKVQALVDLSQKMVETPWADRKWGEFNDQLGEIKEVLAAFEDGGKKDGINTGI